MVKVLIAANDNDFLRSLKVGIRQFKEARIIGSISKPIEDLANVVDKNKIDVLFLDIHFYGISTQSIITHLSEKFPHLRIVYIGHIEDSQYLNLFSQMNGIGILVRPIRQIEIIKIMENADMYFQKLSNKEKLIDGLKRQSVQEKSVFENKFLNSLVKGEISARSEVLQSLMYYESGLMVESGVRVAVLRIDKFQQLALTFETDLDKHAIVEYVKSTMALAFANFPSVVFVDALNEYIVITNNTIDNEMFIKTCDSIREAVRDEFELSVSIGVGKYYTDFYDLSLSYREAIDALRYRYQIGYNAVLSIENITTTENLYNRISYERKDKLIFATITCEAISINRLVDEIFFDLSKSESVTVEFLAMWVISVLIEVGIVAQAQGIEIQHAVTKLCDFNATSQFKNIEEAKFYMKKALSVICEEILINTNRTEGDIYLNTKKYAEENYMFPFSIKRISSEVAASPERVNSIFMKKEGVNIHDYIINKRIDAAKDMLVNTDFTTDIIAVNVGYNSAQYFESIFKQMTNMSTAVYRFNNKNQTSIES